MEKNYNNNGSRIWMGIFIFLAGILLLAYKMGAPLPYWLFTWPVILIGIGLILGIKKRFQTPGSYILILIGVVFFLKENNILNFKIYLGPIILMIIGANFLFNPRGGRRRNSRFMNNQQDDGSTGFASDDSFTPTPSDKPRSNFILMDDGTAPEENVHVNAILGGIKKSVLSKNFTGGTITCFMGGAELNFLHADMQKPVIIECNNIFGGTKLLIPSNWDIKNDITAIFGGVNDKRQFTNVEVNHSKTLHLKGTCLFGGIDISNY